MYATRTDMITRFGEEEIALLTEHDTATGVINDEVLNQALSDASAEIDGYLGGRYDLPFATVPGVLIRTCCEIARYMLHDEHIPEPVEKRYENSVKYLRLLGNGQISLGVIDEGDSSPSSNTAQISSAGSVFNRQDSKDFI